MINTADTRQREVWVDWLRVIACFMVMVVHSSEPFYLGGEGTLITSAYNARWAAFFDVLVRSCVPLFVIASSYLQFPLHYSTGEFFRKRAVRVLVPFAIWSIFYALYWGEPVTNLKSLLLNFNYVAGHLWFVYMLVGLYLIMPLLSPWAEKVGKKELSIYIGIWLFTTLIPLIRDWACDFPLTVIYGPTGIPRQVLYPLYGEASWNTYGTFYYISGFLGYMLIGLWLRKFGSDIKPARSWFVAIACFLAGFAICYFGFIRRVNISSNGVFPVGGREGLAAWWETTWINDTLGVALMTIGNVLMFRKIKSSGRFYEKILLPVSKASYGMYLGHMVALAFYSQMFRSCLDTTPLIIVLTAVCSFVTTAIVAVLVKKIPVIGRFIIG